MAIEALPAREAEPAAHANPERSRILVVDDEEPIRNMMERLLGGGGYAVVATQSAREALEALSREEFALVLTDMMMEGGSGLSLIRQIHDRFPDTAVIMVTGLDDVGLGNSAIQLGAYGFIVKPFERAELLVGVSNALRRRQLEREGRAHREHLERTVAERTAALRDALRQIQEAHVETLRRMGLLAEYRDDETGQHIQRMSRYCAALARRADQSSERAELIRMASPMHDIGKVGIPDRILLKPGRHTPEEFEIMKRHAEIGYRILTGSNSELLNLAATIAWTHHERWDGTGYPRGLAGEAIPLEGRIAAVADVFDALTSKRCYKPAYTVEKSVEIMREQRGKHFEARLLDLFLGDLDEILGIRRQYADAG